MSAEGLLTLFGLLLTVYTIVSPERRLEIRVRLGLLDWVLLGTCLAAVHYILLFPIFDSLGIAPHLGPWRYGFTPETASYTIIAGTSLVVGIRAARRPIPLRRLPALRELLERLLQQERYAEAAFVFERHLTRLRKVSAGDLVTTRIRKALRPNTSDLFMEAHLKAKSDAWYRNRVTRLIGALFPRHEAATDSATDTIHRLLGHEPFVVELAASNPYLGLRIVKEGLDPYKDFQLLWIAALLRDPHSVLYYEIHDNQQMAGGQRFHFPATNRLLNFYFSDPRVAERESVYKSFGDYLHKHLDALLRAPLDDRYNRPTDDFVETGRWRDPVNAVLQVFDFMIPESLHFGIRWHMWLFYLPSFVDKFERNLNPGPGVDPGAEFPTPYHYFIYECVSSLRHWYEEADHLGKDNPNADIGTLDLRLEDSNLTKAIALGLGEVCATVFASTKLSEKYKAYILEVALREFDHISPKTPLSPKQQLLLASISNGGGRYVPDRSAHRANVRRILQNVDHLLRFGVADSLFTYVEPD